MIHGDLIGVKHDADRNRVLNGNFVVQQRPDTQLSASGKIADLWQFTVVGETSTHDINEFTLGQGVVAGEPQYYSSTEVDTATAGAGNYTYNYHRIESVRSFAGKRVTVGFWAKADSGKDIAVNLHQSFGTGGAPSSVVYATPVTRTLTSLWLFYEATFDVPSISGKVLGTDGNDFLQISFWYSAGSNLNAQTNTLGQQTGVFDIALISINPGSRALPYEPRFYQIEEALCQRYYYRITPGSGKNFGIAQGYGTATGMLFIPFPIILRATPVGIEQTGTASDYGVMGATAGTNACTGVPTHNEITQYNATPIFTCTGQFVSGEARICYSNANSGYLGFSAEL